MKPKKADFHVRDNREKHPVRIVADGAISTQGHHGGRLLPLLLLDTTERLDIGEFIRIHEFFGPGDVIVQWGKIDAKGHEGTVALFIKCIRPVELFMVLEFNIVKQGGMVDQMLTGEGVYLAQAQGEDDCLSKNIDRPKVLVEVGDLGFKDSWDDIFHKHLAKDFRSRGMNRSKARQAARSVIEELRKIGKFRLRHVPK